MKQAITLALIPYVLGVLTGVGATCQYFENKNVEMIQMPEPQPSLAPKNEIRQVSTPGGSQIHYREDTKHGTVIGIWYMQDEFGRNVAITSQILD